MNPKDFYRNYQADNIIDDFDRRLLYEILEFSPDSILEFGCGSGKNLKMVKDAEKQVETWGIDISKVNAFQSSVNLVDCVICGDERHLPCREFDVIFTCSVLDHVEDIKGIIAHFKKYTNKAIILAETNSWDKDFYYKHDYESFGFKKTDYSYVSDGDGFEYNIWILDYSTELY